MDKLVYKKYLKLYVDKKGFEADAWTIKYPKVTSHYLEQIHKVLESPEMFVTMLDNYVGFLISKGYTNWNLKTLVMRAAIWKKGYLSYQARMEKK